MGCDATEADDLVQDVFVTFLGSLDRFEGRSQLTTWLIGILHFKVQERRRARAKADESIDDDFESQFDASGYWITMPPDPLRALQGNRLRAALAECLDALPPAQRAAFHLRVVDERSAAEAGNVLGQSVTHIGVLLHRARTRLRECLAQKGQGHRT